MWVGRGGAMIKAQTPINAKDIDLDGWMNKRTNQLMNQHSQRLEPRVHNFLEAMFNR